MKYSIILTGMLAFLASCGGSKSDEKAGSADSNFVSVNAPENSSEAGSTDEDLSGKAVLLWNSSTISLPSKEGKWVASYQFGNTLTLTGKKEENTTEKRTYLEVTGPDGKTGWINEYMVATNSKVGVAIGDVSLYKNPDVMSVSSDKVAVADIIAISGDKKDGFRQIYGKEKKIKGFVNLFDKISSDPIDLKVAVLYHQAMSKTSTDEQVKALQSILDDSSNSSSKIFGIVQSKLAELTGDGEGDGGYGTPITDTTAVEY